MYPAPMQDKGFTKSDLCHIARMLITAVPDIASAEQISFSQKNNEVLGSWSGFRYINPVVS